MRFVTDKMGLKIILIPKKREYDKNGILREVPGKSIQFVNGVYNTKDKKEIEILIKERLVYTTSEDVKEIKDAIDGVVKAKAIKKEKEQSEQIRRDKQKEAIDEGKKENENKQKGWPFGKKNKDKEELDKQGQINNDIQTNNK